MQFRVKPDIPVRVISDTFLINLRSGAGCGQMLREFRKVEQRYDAVLGVIRDGSTVSEVAQAYGISRQSIHSNQARYEARGLPARSKSRGPKT